MASDDFRIEHRYSERYMRTMKRFNINIPNQERMIELLAEENEQLEQQLAQALEHARQARADAVNEMESATFWKKRCQYHEPKHKQARALLEEVLTSGEIQFEYNGIGADTWRCDACGKRVDVIYDPPGHENPPPDPFPHEEDCVLLKIRAFLAGKEQP